MIDSRSHQTPHLSTEPVHSVFAFGLPSARQLYGPSKAKPYVDYGEVLRTPCTLTQNTILHIAYGVS